MIGGFSNAFLAGVVPGLVGTAFDAILLMNEETSKLVLNSVLLIIASQSLRSLLQFVRNFSAEVFAQRFERDIRDELYASLLGKSMSYHDMQPVGETMARVTNDVREMNLMMNPGINLTIGANMFLITPAIYSPGHPSRTDPNPNALYRIAHPGTDLLCQALAPNCARRSRQLWPDERSTSRGARRIWKSSKAPHRKQARSRHLKVLRIESETGS